MQPAYDRILRSYAVSLLPSVPRTIQVTPIIFMKHCCARPSLLKSWKDTFANKTTNIIQVDGTVDNAKIAVNFAKHFESICTPFNSVRNRISLKMLIMSVE